MWVNDATRLILGSAGLPYPVAIKWNPFWELGLYHATQFSASFGALDWIRYGERHDPKVSSKWREGLYFWVLWDLVVLRILGMHQFVLNYFKWRKRHYLMFLKHPCPATWGENCAKEAMGVPTALCGNLNPKTFIINGRWVDSTIVVEREMPHRFPMYFQITAQRHFKPPSNFPIMIPLLAELHYNAWAVLKTSLWRTVPAN